MITEGPTPLVWHPPDYVASGPAAFALAPVIRAALVRPPFALAAFGITALLDRLRFDRG